MIGFGFVSDLSPICDPSSLVDSDLTSSSPSDVLKLLTPKCACSCLLISPIMSSSSSKTASSSDDTESESESETESETETEPETDGAIALNKEQDSLALLVVHSFAC